MPTLRERILAHPAVQEVDGGRTRNIFVYLKPGWLWSEQRCFGCETVQEAWRLTNQAYLTSRENLPMVEEIVLWCRDGTSDKLWGVADYQGRAITFWGRRNKELAFKLLSADEQRKLSKTVESKKSKGGYRESSFAELERETEGFKAEFDQMLLVAILGDGYRHTSTETLAQT